MVCLLRACCVLTPCVLWLTTPRQLLRHHRGERVCVGPRGAPPLAIESPCPTSWRSGAMISTMSYVPSGRCPQKRRGSREPAARRHTPPDVSRAGSTPGGHHWRFARQAIVAASIWGLPRRASGTSRSPAPPPRRPYDDSRGLRPRSRRGSSGRVRQPRHMRGSIPARFHQCSQCANRLIRGHVRM
jgi:hypothetical protein